MKHIMTKPTTTKLLLAVTSQSVLYFLRVKAYNHIENYCRIAASEMGIQEIVSMNYLHGSSILVCMEKLNDFSYCLKYLKVNCSYEKVEIFTESVKMPVAQYSHQFRMGGREGHEWLSAVDYQNVIHWMYLESKKCEKIEYSKPIKEYVVLSNGGIFREETQVITRLQRN
jgi:hypothetical protein